MDIEKKVITIATRQLAIEFAENPHRFRGHVAHDGDLVVDWDNSLLENGLYDQSMVRTRIFTKVTGNNRVEMEITALGDRKSYSYRTSFLIFDSNYRQIRKIAKILQNKKEEEKRMKDLSFLNDLFPHMNDHKLLGK